MAKNSDSYRNRQDLLMKELGLTERVFGRERTTDANRLHAIFAASPLMIDRALIFTHSSSASIRVHPRLKSSPIGWPLD